MSSSNSCGSLNLFWANMGAVRVDTCIFSGHIYIGVIGSKGHSYDSVLASSPWHKRIL